MKDKINLAMIGLGARGIGLLQLVYLQHEDVEIPVVCDVYEDRCQEAADLIEKTGRKRPITTTNYKDILNDKDIDAVILCTSWDKHINICIEFMEVGKYVGCEVGGAHSIQECWKLVEAYERTKTPVMLLENCIYGRDEMMIENMSTQGILGKIVHCEGGYRHDLREEIAYGKEKRHYRLLNYIHRNGENYPTHELGPIAKILKINRGNRMISLTSIASKSWGMKEYIKEHKADDIELVNTDFAQGDIVNTIITCANGETITLTLDTTLPRYYSRGFYVQGTKGMYCEDNKSLFIEGEEHEKDHFNWQKHWGNVEQYREKYDHPVWKKYLSEGIKQGHDGMDWLVFCDFVDCVKNKTEVPIDVYDMAAWMCITALSEQSIAMGGQPVAIPDFTNGAWISRK
ncbi:Gfo/Idh/MocA family oxidoreductase [uncultured Tyzzerella sp.]|uniref:Gfo/Idh/MocA family protein n=1 Tax=uncultured Tyzzerella sp. TaxID=2321398 RepID=UPI00294224E0|nr:Gfo/Idh/MocA family oxidoreductase [uncultured Tyzzerella sp.]